MRRRDYYWCLYHDAEFNQIDNLRTDQVEAVYAAIPKSMLPQWWIWRDGLDDWKPFADFPELLKSLRKTEEAPVVTPPVPVGNTYGRPKSKPSTSSKPSEPEIKPSSIQDEKTLTGTRMAPKEEEPPARVEKEIRKFDFDPNEQVELTLMRTGIGEDRNHFRFETALDVRIIVGSRVFANKTVNISLKGMQLKSPLPKNLPRYFNVEIRKKDTVIPVVCSEVKNPDGSPSNRVKIEVNDHAPALLAILLAG